MGQLVQRQTWIPLLLFVLAALGLGLNWRVLSRHEHELLALRSSTTTEQTAFRLDNFIAARLHLVEQIRREWLRQRAVTQERFTDVSRALQAQFTTFQAVNWIDPQGIIRWVVPEESNLPARDRDMAQHAGLKEILDRARATGEPAASPPLTLFQGGRGFGTYFPIQRGASFEGYLNGVFRIEPLIEDCLRQGVREHFFLRIRDGQAELFSDASPNTFDEPLARSHKFKVLDRTWTVTLAPKAHLRKAYRTYSDDVLFVTGLILAGGLALALRGVLRRQQAILESEQRLRLAVENMPVLVVAFDGRGRIIVWNRHCERVTGYAAEEVVGHPEVLGRICPDGPGSSAASPSCFRWPDQPGDNLHAITDKQGRTRTLEWSNGSSRYRVPGWAIWGVGVDMTERVNAEQAHQEAESRRLEIERHLLETQRLESLGLLAGGIAHDLNNLLTTMMGSAGLVRLGLPAGSPGIAHVDHIEAAAQQAADLARQLLAYSGKGKFVVSVADLNELAHETADLLRVSMARPISLEYQLCDSRLPIEGDVTQIRQVIMNLVVNASEALGEAGGTIDIRTRREDRPEGQASAHPSNSHPGAGSFAVLEVADNGPGMDDHTRARIFEPFFSTKATGRGLGLAAVVGIIRGHRGAILVDSAPGRGTTFRVFLPLAGAVPDGRDPAAAAHSGPGRTILVVDDEPGIRQIAQVILGSEGYDVLTAADGLEALEQFKAEPDRFSLVLLDMTMPRMGGEDALRAMRAIRPELNVIISSGYNENDQVGVYPGTGRTSFIQKPYRADELLASIQSALNP